MRILVTVKAHFQVKFELSKMGTEGGRPGGQVEGMRASGGSHTYS